MIEYLNLLDENRDLTGTIEHLPSIIWNTQYFDTGDFEFIVPATNTYLTLINESEYVSRPDDENIGVIEYINVKRTGSEKKITVRGRFIKSILDRRIIGEPSIFVADVSSRKVTLDPVGMIGNVETAMRRLVSQYAGPTANSKRTIPFLVLGNSSGSSYTFSSRRQTTASNLLTFTDETLKEFGLGAKMTMNENKNFVYSIYEGVDRTHDNEEGNDPVIFSSSFDNLTDTEKTYDITSFKNASLIGGSGEGSERFYSYGQFWDSVLPQFHGIDRREVFIDARDQSKTYQQNGSTVEYSDSEYVSMLQECGKERMTEYVTKDDFTGTINLAKSPFKYKTDFNVGDIITVIDDDKNVYTKRLVTITEVQDNTSGYMIVPKFE